MAGMWFGTMVEWIGQVWISLKTKMGQKNQEIEVKVETRKPVIEFLGKRRLKYLELESEEMELQPSSCEDLSKKKQVSSDTHSDRESDNETLEVEKTKKAIINYKKRQECRHSSCSDTTDSPLEVVKEKMDKLDISCPICLSDLISPHIANCGHSFCHKCIYEYLLHSKVS